jgi:uncharacterized membrane protein
MNVPNHSVENHESRLTQIHDDVRRAFVTFLTVPSLITAGFILLAAVTYFFDHAAIARSDPFRAFMKAHLFRDSQATSSLLGAIAGSIITVTSITFSLLLLAVQQSASSLTNQVFDQFLRRRLNQVYFGFFVGLALYTLVILATVDPSDNPVYGATVAFLLTGVALYLLVLLLYTTINQTRPVEIIATIHDHTLVAREHQRAFLRRTRRSPCGECGIRLPVTATGHGFVISVNLDSIGAAIENARADVEVVLLVSVGTFVAFRDVIAEVRAQTMDDAIAVANILPRAIHLERQRDFANDPAYGIEQLLTIAWTSISTAKSNPSPGLLVIHNLRDMLARWSVGEEAGDEPALPVVYTDNVPARLLDAFESLAVVSSESMQHQSITEIIHTLTMMFDRLPPDWQQRADDLILRILSSLGDYVLTAGLDAALTALVRTLTDAMRLDTAMAVESAQTGLRASVGHLHSRSTRVSGGG